MLEEIVRVQKEVAEFENKNFGHIIISGSHVYLSNKKFAELFSGKPVTRIGCDCEGFEYNAMYDGVLFVSFSKNPNLVSEEEVKDEKAV